jgi:hypothetical protein
MIKKIIIVITLLITAVGYSQKNNTSAYSFFGIGDQNSGTTTEQSSMGGIGVALGDEYHLNFLNPAANASLQFTTYSIGLHNANLWAKDNVDRQRAGTTFLSYLAMGVPLSQKAGFTFGIMPNSTVGYSLVSNVYTGDVITEATAYEGEGGSNKVFAGIGIEVFKGLSLGFQGNYIFGNIENSITNQKRDVALGTKYETNSSLKGFGFNGGIQYKANLKNDLNLHLGTNIKFENDIKAEGNEYLYSLSLGSGEFPKDTVLNVSSEKTIISPMKSSLGIGLGKKNKWFAGLDYINQGALDLDNSPANSFSKVKYEDYSKIAIGGFYIPKFNSITSYWERVIYRAGLKFVNTGLAVDATGNGSNFTSIKDFGISFGVGLPVGNQLSNLNVGLEYGKRGKTDNGLVQENYVNFRLSLSLSDKWFNKRKIF